MLIVIAILVIIWGIFAIADIHIIWGGILVCLGFWILFNQTHNPTLQEQKQRCEQAGFFWEESGKVVLEGDDYVADGECVKDIP